MIILIQNRCLKWVLGCSHGPEDPAIGHDVANSLLARGRVADAAVLLARLPKAEPLTDELERASHRDMML